MRSQVRTKPSLRLHLSNQSVGSLLSKCQSFRATNLISLSQASKREMISEWGCFWPRNVGGFFSVLIHELVQKFHDSRFSLYSTAERTLVQDLAVETKWAIFHKSDFPVVGFVECSLFFFQLVQATFSCPPAAISSHNISQPRVSWKIQKATGYIYSKRFKRARRLHTKGKEQNSSSVRVGTR